MPAAPRPLNLDLDAPDAASDGGLRAAGDLHALALAGLLAGPEARRAALGVLRWLDGGDGTDGPLDATLGLAAPGRNHARQRLRTARRDAALRRLWRVTCPNLGRTAAGGFLATKWRRYEASAWLHHRVAGAEPVADPEHTFCNLMRRGLRPLAADTIRKILD